VIFDSDGVLVQEGEPIEGATDLINFLHERGKEVVVLSNNSTKHPSDMERNYHRKGLNVDRIINAGMITVNYCTEQGISSVFVVGEAGLVSLLEEHDIRSEVSAVDAVIVGMDRGLTYKKLAIATRLIRQGSDFIGTNPDPSFPTPRGLEPGAGSMIAALEASTGAKPLVVLGKPERFGYELAMKTSNVTAEQCLMIGDRYETDILGAIRVNMPSLVVNTGIAATRSNPGVFGNHPRVPVVQSLRDLLYT